MAPQAWLLLRNAKALTMDPARPEAEAVAIAHGRILAVGSDSEIRSFAGRGTRALDLRGRTLLPGFVDAHSHLSQHGLDLLRLDLSPARSLVGAMRLLRKQATRVRPPGWIVGHSFDETNWTRGRLPSASDLEAAAPGRKVLLRRIDGHSAVASPAALSSLDFGTAGVVERKAGTPTGALSEEAADIAMRAVPHDPALALRGLRAASREMHSLGVTSVAETVEAWQVETHETAAKKGARRIRVRAMACEPDLENALARGAGGDDWIQHGAMKLYTDGSVGSHTAALSRPFSDRPDRRGLLLYSKERLRALVARAHAAGFQACLHAIGERAIASSLDAIEEALRRSPKRDHRHRIEHFLLPEPNHVQRAARLGIVASVQPNFLGRWGGRGGMYERRLGAARARKLLPLRALADAGVPIAFGSDGMPYGPLFGIHCAVNARSPRQRLGVEESLRAYTRGAAFAMFRERAVGTIAPGMLADLVVLGKDPRRSPSQIRKIPVEMTILGGRVVHGRAASQRSARRRP